MFCASCGGRKAAPLLTRITLQLALAFLPLHSLSANIYCPNTLNQTEQAICADPELLRLDRQVSDRYESALAASSAEGRRPLEDEQSRWANRLVGCGVDAACIKRRYLDRIPVLEEYLFYFTRAAKVEQSGPKARVSSVEQPRPAEPPDNSIKVEETPQPTLRANDYDSRVDETPLPNFKADGYDASQLGPITTPSPSSAPSKDTPAQVPRVASEQETQSEKANRVLLGFLGVIVVAAAIYMIPTIIAFQRQHRSRWIILAINLAFGATIVGWIIALVLAMNKVDDPLKGGTKYDPQPHDPIL